MERSRESAREKLLSKDENDELQGTLYGREDNDSFLGMKDEVSHLYEFFLASSQFMIYQ